MVKNTDRSNTVARLQATYPCDPVNISSLHAACLIKIDPRMLVKGAKKIISKQDETNPAGTALLHLLNLL